MNLIHSTSHQCAPAAFAMCLGITLEEMLKLLRHNGLERICDAPEPNCFRGFHPQEFVDILLTRGWSLTMIELEPKMIHGEHVIDHGPLIWPLPKQRFFSHMFRHTGVVFGDVNGIGHAIAWDHEEQTIYDPRGRIYRVYDPFPDFNFRQFFIMQRTI